MQAALVVFTGVNRKIDSGLAIGCYSFVTSRCILRGRYAP